MQPILYCKKISNEITTIKDAITCNDVQLSELKRDGKEQLQAVLIKFIEGMLIYFGKQKTDMSSTQVIMIVSDIIDKYYYLHIEDVCMCFKKARTDSKYPKFYGAIDGKTILSWFALYDSERDKVVQSLPVKVPEVVRKASYDDVSREEYTEIIKAKIAGGDLYAMETLLMIERTDAFMRGASIDYGNYKYHKFKKLTKAIEDDEKRRRK